MIGLIAPFLVAAALAVFIPMVLMREASPISRNKTAVLVISLLILFLLTAGYFFAAYLALDVKTLDVMKDNTTGAALHFARLAMYSAFFWAPIVFVVVSYRPDQKGQVK